MSARSQFRLPARAYLNGREKKNTSYFDSREIGDVVRREQSSNTSKSDAHRRPPD